LFEVDRVRVGLFDITETLEDSVTGSTDGTSVLDVGNAVRESIVGLLVSIVEGDTEGLLVEPDEVGIIVVHIVGPEEGMFSSGSCVGSADKDVVGDKVSTVEDDGTGAGSSKGCGMNILGKRNALGNCCTVGILVKDGTKIIGGLVGLLVDIDGSVGLLVGFLDGIIETLGLDDTLDRNVGTAVGKNTGATVVSGSAALLLVGITVGVKVLILIGSDVSSSTVVVGLGVGCNESMELGSGLGISVV
jgi:hypothetical protein